MATYQSSSYEQHHNTNANPNAKSTRRERLKQWTRRAVAGAALGGVLAAGIAASVAGAKAHNKHVAENNARQDTAVEKVVQPALDKIGSKVLDLYNAQGKNGGVIRAIPGKKPGEIELVSDVRNEDLKFDHETTVVMKTKPDGAPDPTQTIYAEFKHNSGDITGTKPKEANYTDLQLATGAGSAYVTTVDNGYRAGSPYAESFGSIGHDPDLIGLVDTASKDMYYAPIGENGSAEGTAADVASLVDDNLTLMQDDLGLPK